MKFKILASLMSVALLVGCPATDKKSAKAQGKKPDASIPSRNPAGDVTFQGFVGRLKIAVATYDLETLSTMMAPDFGYRWDATPEGESAFSYWDENNLWPRLSALLSEPWSENDGYMVVPPQVVQDANYNGYRAGIAMNNGSWRFAYFVPAPPPQQQ